MKGSLRIASFAGIGVYVHWTFSLLIAFVVFSLSSQENATLASVLIGVALILAVFLCVVLHEFGHALAARRFGVQTRDITLLPIGGMARMERIPENPTQEIVIALAGPAVNVAIASLLFFVILFTAGPHAFADAAKGDGQPIRFSTANFLPMLLSINVILVVFNMIPAFPMDGGRVFRALLAYATDYVTATDIASRLGQILAIGMAFVGLFLTGNVWLVIVGVFVFLAGSGEAHAVRVRAAFRGRSVRDAMLTRFVSLDPGDPISRAVEELLAGSQTEFPVTDADGRLLGILSADDLLRALSERGPDGSIADAMRRSCPTSPPETPLEEAIARLQSDACTAMPVIDGDRLLGLLTVQNASELMAVRSALRRFQARS